MMPPLPWKTCQQCYGESRVVAADDDSRSIATGCSPGRASVKVELGSPCDGT
ncbi:hypothetical protein HMPREF9593_02246 [Cutibacterium acnes HL046PA2]|nr:hypothetical protein HMPREF9593_02246 [Cutibacterium acnes HL046PA2]EFS62469.1 hypothetical protein HMPREF9605_00327 [Cutibacterium acnes HL036PA2]